MRDLEEQTILITGATSGLGRALAERAAGWGTRVLLHGRDEDRVERLRDELTSRTGNEWLEVVVADLAELRQVDELAQEVLRLSETLDVLVNNAGVGFGADDTRREESTDGIELRFAVNYLAHYRLTTQLLGLLRESAPARVVNVASAGQHAVDFDDPMLTRDYSGTRAYAQSKLAQIAFAFDLAEQLGDAQVAVTALHPATYMNTAMVREAGISPLNTLEQGLEPLVRLVSDPAFDGVSGRYFHGAREAEPLEQARDPRAREQLRELSERLVREALG